MKTQTAILLGLALGAIFIAATNNTEKKLTIKEAAIKAGVSESVIKNFILLGSLKSFIENNVVYVLQSELNNIQILNQ